MQPLTVYLPGKAKVILAHVQIGCEGFQEVEAPKIFRQSAREGGKFVSPMHRPPLPPGETPGTNFC